MDTQKHSDSSSTEPAPPALPDYLTDPDAVSKDKNAAWRFGRAPDYANTRKVWAETKRMNHEAGSLPQLVENLVKNWELEASFKTSLSDWRTIDRPNYSFAINGGPPQSGEHMLRVGTYNAILAPNEYYSPEHSDFASSHKTFKRMMPTFAWEVLEVYSGPPTVAFRWRHWGVMKNDYVGFNDKGEKVTAKAHGGTIDIQGVTVASVDESVRLRKVETWFDPMEMFRQIAPNGIVNKQPVERKVGSAPSDYLEEEEAAGTGNTPTTPQTEDELRESGIEAASGNACPFAGGNREMPAVHPLVEQTNGTGETHFTEPAIDTTSLQAITPTGTSDTGIPESKSPSSSVEGRTRHDTLARQIHEAQTRKLDERPFPHPHDMEEKVHPEAGEAVVAEKGSRETVRTKEEMETVTDAEMGTVMNVE